MIDKIGKNKKFNLYNIIIMFLLFSLISIAFYVNYSLKQSNKDFENFVNDVKSESMAILNGNEEFGYVREDSIESLKDKINETKKDNYEVIISTNDKPADYGKDMFIKISIRRLNYEDVVIESEDYYLTTKSKYKNDNG